MNAVTPTLQGLNVFEVADRVVTQGTYARFSQQDQLALCLFVSGLRPSETEPFRVTIIAGRAGQGDVEETARRMNAAKTAAEFVLAHGHADLPAKLEDVITAVIDANEEVREARHDTRTGLRVLGARLRLEDAVAKLRTAFEESFNGR